MYGINWDEETGGILLCETKSEGIRGEVRPVYREELDLFGFDRHWSYPRQCVEPLLWATPGRNYYYRGELVAEARGGGFFELPEVHFHRRGLNLEPVAVRAMLDRNAAVMDGLSQCALEFIHKVHRKYRKRVGATAVAFSGGKDSLVLLDLVQRALPPDEFTVVFSDTTMEIGATYAAVERAKRKWSHLDFNTARADMDAQTTWRELGPPSRIHRWCCTVHKSAPTLLLLRELTGRLAVRALMFDGVRREESQARSGYFPVSEGSKHNAQVNVSPLLEWSAAEVFLYLFDRDICFNEAYRHGFVRVGCAVCPLSSKWWDSISWLVFRHDVTPFVEILHDYARNKKISKKEIEVFIREGGWKGRAGGRDLENGGQRVLERDGGEATTFLIRQPRENWLEWVKALGPVVRQGPDRGWIENGGAPYSFQLRRIGPHLEVTVGGIARGDRYLRYHLRSIANKVAYCVHCRGCEVECPTGALRIGDSVSIDGEACIHCRKCLSFAEKGCLTAKSLMITRDGTGVKGLNRYQHFGMRKEWLDEFFRDPEDWWHRNKLGNRQFEAMRVWLREAEIVEKNRLTPLGARLRELGVDNPLTWGVIWTNLSRNSELVGWYVRNVAWGVIHTKSELVDMLDHRLAQSSRKNAITALVGLLRDTPLGGGLGLGEVRLKGRNVAAVGKRGWEEASPLAVLYSLYRYAERVGRHDLSLGELFEAAPEGPHTLFGMPRDDLARMLRGLSARWEGWLSVEVMRDLDNLYLDASRNAAEVLELG